MRQFIIVVSRSRQNQPGRVELNCRVQGAAMLLRSLGVSANGHVAMTYTIRYGRMTVELAAHLPQ